MKKRSRPGSVSLRHHQQSSRLHTIPARSDISRCECELAHVLEENDSAIIESSGDAIFTKTPDGVIVSWNKASERMYGYTESEIIGKPVSVLVPSEKRDELSDLLLRLGQGERIISLQTIRAKKDGTPINVSVTISPIVDAHGRFIGASAITRDITEQKRSEESIRYAALHDSLTDLLNYGALIERFDAELHRSDRTGRPFALLLLDVDRLKEINDQYGHLVGSRALCRLAGVLKRTCRSIDSAARYGGDEFAVLLPESSEAAALSVQCRIRKELAEDAEQPFFTVSAGIAVYPEDGSTFENIFVAADKALYSKKPGDGIRVCSHRSKALF